MQEDESKPDFSSFFGHPSFSALLKRLNSLKEDWRVHERIAEVK